MRIKKDLPPWYFTSIFIGSQGSGKTYSVGKLLIACDKYRIYAADGILTMRVIVFCPTINSSANPIYESSKHLDENNIILDYSDDKLLDKLHEMEEEENSLKIIKSM